MTIFGRVIAATKRKHKDLATRTRFLQKVIKLSVHCAIVAEAESGVALCEANPCGDSAASLPREDLSDDCYWDDVCQPHVCLPIKPGDAGRGCLLVRSGDRLGCPGSGAVSSTFLASRSCPLRRTWSPHRQRCVRVYGTRNI